MDRFDGRIAVITGGGTGMGRELARQLTSEGCHVAMCDLSDENMQQTRALCEEVAPAGTKITTHVADVSEQADVNATPLDPVILARNEAREESEQIEQK